MDYLVEYDLYIHVRGEAVMDHKPEKPMDILDEIVPGGCDGEILSVLKDPSHMDAGYMEVTPLDDNDKDDDDDDEIDDE